MVAYGPGESALDHTPEEAMDLREYQRAIDVLKRVLEVLVGADVAAAGGADSD